jgi:hypothetical protein
MNPPFTRKQLIGKEYRKILSRNFPEYKEYESKEQSLFGYFVFLSDRFLKPAGRMGFVLPSTSIRQGSSKGMRQLLRDKYDIDYIILSGHRMAFSEDAAFSEILIIAEKRPEKKKPKENIILATIRKKPTLENMSVVVSQLKDALVLSDNDKINRKIITTDFLDYRIGSIDELKNEDWLSLLPGQEKIGIELPESTIFSTFQKYLGQDKLIQGIRFEGSSDYVNVTNTLISNKREVGTRVNWLIIEENKNTIRVRSQKSGVEIDIPRSVLLPATRSPAGLDKMEIIEPPDYVVCNRFDNDELFWETDIPDFNKRNEHFKSRQGRLLLAGRNHIDIVSEGTHHLSFCTSENIVPTWSFWSFKIDNPDDAKILCLWLNSIFSMTHLYDKRITGTGIYIGWLKSDILNLIIPDPQKIPVKIKDDCLTLFNKIGHCQFPSLMSQLKNREKNRLLLDLSIARLFNVPKYNNEKEIIALYDEIINRFETLKEVHNE